MMMNKADDSGNPVSRTVQSGADSLHAPTVSVIVPVYNVRDYLQEGVESLLRQTYRNLEILLIDDGSDDGSELLCDQFMQKDSRVRVIHQQNRGLSAARNAGLDAMRGEYVAFLDPDDAFRPDMIRRLTEAILRENADIAVCGFDTCKTEGRLTSGSICSRFSPDEGVYSADAALVMLFDVMLGNSVWNKVYARRLFEKRRFLEGKVYEDMLLMPALISASQKTVVISDALVFHRKRQHSITATVSGNNIRDWYRARKAMERFLAERCPGVFSAEQKKRFYEGSVRIMLMRCMDLLECRTAEQNRVRRILERDLFRRKREIRSYTWKIRLTYYCYRLHPEFCLFLRKCKRLFIKPPRRIKQSRFVS